jgi:hypothetical protein
MNPIEIGWDGVDWIHLAEGTYQWWAFMNGFLKYWELIE